MQKIKVGDRVRHQQHGDGTIKEICGGNCCAVEYDNLVSYGHTCCGRCKDGYGWNCWLSELTLIPMKEMKKAIKKPYWVEVKSLGEEYVDPIQLSLMARNGRSVLVSFYNTKREARQMARRLSENLGIEFRQSA